MNWWLLSIPLISACIGWISIWLAIKFLFHPKNPILILGFTIQGIIPKRQKQFAQRVGKLVGEELFSFNEIEQKITSLDNLKKLTPAIDQHVDEFLHKKLSKAMPMISMFIGEKTINTLKILFMQELSELFPQLMRNYMVELKNELDLERIVTARVAALSSDKLELILYQIISKEFRLARITGAIIGFLIGLLQVLITELASR